jgi:hypothetical protein
VLEVGVDTEDKEAVGMVPEAGLGLGSGTETGSGSAFIGTNIALGLNKKS